MRQLSTAWNRLNGETVGTDGYWQIALQNAAFYADMKPLVAKYVRGRTLDVGAGRLAWRGLLRYYSSAYFSGDLTREHPELDMLFDATGSYPFADGAFDTVFCCSVLEHAREPWLAFSEMWRVLAPGGMAIVSVPFVFYLHGQPHDYYRFSRYGLTYLAQRANFEVVEIVTNGSLLQLLMNIPSMALSMALSAIGLRPLIPPVTRFFLSIDKLLSPRLERGGLFAMNHLAVLRKPVDTGGR